MKSVCAGLCFRHQTLGTLHRLLARRSPTWHVRFFFLFENYILFCFGICVVRELNIYIFNDVILSVNWNEKEVLTSSTGVLISGFRFLFFPWGNKFVTWLGRTRCIHLSWLLVVQAHDLFDKPIYTKWMKWLFLGVSALLIEISLANCVACAPARAFNSQLFIFTSFFYLLNLSITFNRLFAYNFFIISLT